MDTSWVRFGFSEWDAKEWQKYHFDPLSAFHWYTGLPHATIEYLQSIGADFNRILYECPRRLTPEDADKWRWCGCTAEVAHRWTALFGSPENFLLWLRSGWTEPEAWRWLCAQFYDPKEAQYWKEAGFSPGVAAQWSTLGVKPAEAKWWTGSIDQAKEWIAYGYSLKEAIHWSQSGFTPQDARQWQSGSVLITPFEAKYWRSEGFNITEAHKWMLIFGGMPHEARQWRDKGFTAVEAKKWRDAGFSLKDACSWQMRGFTHEDSKEGDDDE